MPSFPSPGTVTVCEINREWITDDSLSDDRAKETYGKILGMVFSPLPFQLDQSASPSHPEQENEVRQEENGPTAESIPAEGMLATVWGITTSYLRRLSSPTNVKLLSEVDLHGISWHQNKHILAFISGPNQVSVRDFEDSECNDPALLTNESQRDVKVLEWRPNGGRMLAVACRGGVCIWAASYPGNTATVRSGAPSFIGAMTRSSGLRWTLVDFFRSQNDAQISALSWSPDGRYLASASYESSSFTIWDVAQGVGTPIRRGLGGISMLKWSPTGDYFFAAKFDGTFYLWETNTWTSELWSSTSGIVTGAVWDPDGRMILVSFSKSATLASIHFSAKPPSMDALLLPVELPEISSLANGECIEKIAWSASGERLAVSFKGGDEAHQGLIAIYDVRRTSVISASLIGYIRGPGDCPKPIAFSFHDKFKQGPLLSVEHWISFYFGSVNCTMLQLYKTYNIHDYNISICLSSAGAVAFAVPIRFCSILLRFLVKVLFSEIALGRRNAEVQCELC